MNIKDTRNCITVAVGDESEILAVLSDREGKLGGERFVSEMALLLREFHPLALKGAEGSGERTFAESIWSNEKRRLVWNNVERERSILDAPNVLDGDRSNHRPFPLRMSIQPNCRDRLALLLEHGQWAFKAPRS
jgi:hypothetical protein